MISHPDFPLPALCLIAAASLGGTACAADSSQAGLAVRDSAGITIIESATPAWSTGEGWTVDPRHAVEIGVVDGPEEYTLSGVSGVVRLSDGRIVIANSGTKQLRAYDAQGRFLSAVGGEGDGPREYRYLFGVFRLPGDTIVGWDDSRVRALFYSPDLEYIGATQSTKGGEAGYDGNQPRVRWLLGMRGVLDDGSLIGLGFDPSAPPPPLDQIHQQQMFALRVDRTGAWADDRTDRVLPDSCRPAGHEWRDRRRSAGGYPRLQPPRALRGRRRPRVRHSRERVRSRGALRGRRPAAPHPRGRPPTSGRGR